MNNTKRKSCRQESTGFSFWRRRRDSNPRAVAGKLISSQPRYDHFDTSPYEIVTQAHRERSVIQARKNTL